MRTDSQFNATVLALSGGIGGAKLALGLYQVLGERLTVVANTGDDFEHFGFSISPDLDTLMYTLAGVSNTETGWGRGQETWNFMAAMEALGEETWFALGDSDLATHVVRGQRLRAGHNLTDITADLCAKFGVRAKLLPMTDTPVRTIVKTDHGLLPFQHYFVRDRCTPVVKGFRFDGIEKALPCPQFLASLSDAELGAVIICPSNPFISIDPILSLNGVKKALRAASAPVIAVSPIIGGAAVKGPTGKMMRELGLPLSANAIAGYYGDLLDGFVVDEKDADESKQLSIPVRVTKTLMTDLRDRENLAREVLAFSAELA